MKLLPLPCLRTVLRTAGKIKISLWHNWNSSIYIYWTAIFQALPARTSVFLALYMYIGVGLHLSISESVAKLLIDISESIWNCQQWCSNRSVLCETYQDNMGGSWDFWSCYVWSQIGRKCEFLSCRLFSIPVLVGWYGWWSWCLRQMQRTEMLDVNLTRKPVILQALN